MSLRSLLVLVLLASPHTAPAAPPVVLDDRLILEQVAQQPDVVTPTGLTVDERGRVWVIENHTHQRPSGYSGPTSDRIRILADLDATGRARTVTTFADGFKDTMSLAFAPDGQLYLATRSEIFLLRRKGDNLIERKSLLRLVTSGTYPHNGLCGFAFDVTGRMVFGMGENLGADYQLIGADGTTLRGGGEGGNLFACRPDGSGLTRLATGFWNPFAHNFDAFGRLFVVDNDPDERGPCRLLHILPGGDYGYRFRYGRKGTHPFQCWDGELPGTLGMVAGTGEAPSGVLAYEAANLPADYRGDLLVTSWGDHTIERYHLLPAGASFKARMATVVRGGEDFRPVAIATGPDGAVYFSDWVDKSYPVHGKGRVWRLRARQPTVADDGLRPTAVAALPPARQVALLADPRWTIRTATTQALAVSGRRSNELLKPSSDASTDLRGRLHALWAAALLGEHGTELIAAARRAAEPELRAEAVRLGDARSARALLKDSSPAVRLQAILRVDQLELVVPFLADDDPFLAGAAIHVLGRPANVPLLLRHAGDREPRLRLGVLLALRHSGEKDARRELPRFLADEHPDVRRAAVQWVGEERLREFAGDLERVDRLPLTPALFQALLAARHLLGGGKPDADPVDEAYLARVLADAKQPPLNRSLALRTLRPNHPARSHARLRQLVQTGDSSLRVDALRLLAHQPDAADEAVLRQRATSTSADDELRAEAILGLAHRATAATVRKELTRLLDAASLRRDALRSLRGASPDAGTGQALLAWWERSKLHADERAEMAGQLVLVVETNPDPQVAARLPILRQQAERRPANESEWQTRLASGGDPTAGRRVFFHPNGPGCFRCHRIDGFGESIGPDLSAIGDALRRERLVESILQPSKEVAPRYTSWRIVTDDGKVRVGMITDEGAHSVITLADSDGKLQHIHRKNVEERSTVPTSIMPDRLAERMTPREFADLIAYLQGRRAASRSASK